VILRGGRVQAELEIGSLREQEAGRSLETVFRQLASGDRIESTADELAEAMTL
jgi:hypothetical protein